MELNHQAVRPGTGFEAALHAVALPSLTVVALGVPDAGLEPARFLLDRCSAC